MTRDTVLVVGAGASYGARMSEPHERRPPLGKDLARYLLGWYDENAPKAHLHPWNIAMVDETDGTAPSDELYDAAAEVRAILAEAVALCTPENPLGFEQVMARLLGEGEAITPGAEVVQFPALLDFPPPKLRAYPRETVVAEKVEAMVKLGMANSRMKDFFDVVVLSEMFDFDGSVLARAIRATFERRGTSLPDALPVALTPEFSLDAAKQSQWTAFLRKSNATAERRDLARIVAAATTFLEKPLQAARSASPWAASWQKPGPWLTRWRIDLASAGQPPASRVADERPSEPWPGSTQ